MSVIVKTSELLKVFPILVGFMGRLSLGTEGWLSESTSVNESNSSYYQKFSKNS
jgi:hypothetical protein